jgi:RHS repeat-associated protein
VGTGYYDEDYAYNISTGNLASKTGMGTYDYNDAAHKHAVTHLNSVQKYWYDCNGNMTTRVAGGTYNLTYDAENRMVGVSGTTSQSFIYDPVGHQAGVWTYTSGQGWVQRGASISVTFADGDQLGARATANGEVKVYKNGSLLGTRDVSAWPYYDDGGYIGVWLLNAGDAVMDDFGGGTYTQAMNNGISVASAPWEQPILAAYGSDQTGKTKALYKTIAASTIITTTFTYDGDGNRVKSIVNGETTIYLGSYLEWTGSTSTMKKYYYAGTTRVAMRTGVMTDTTGINWLFGDHLGSQSITTDENGNKYNPPVEVRYKAWGEERYTSGDTPTSFGYTGQRSEMESLGLYFYGSRWYDPALGRWAQPDSIIPGSYNPLAFDRYQYLRHEVG